MNKNQESKANILIIDDDSVLHYLIWEILKNENYNFETATNGKDGLQIARNKKIDLILLDIMIPDMDGFTVCKELQRNVLTSQIPVIFLSTMNDEQSYAKGFELGAVDYLLKPINQLDLKLKIRNYLKLSRNEKRLKESELRYKSIVDDQTEYIIRITPQGKVNFANSAFCNFINIKADKIAGMEINKIFKSDNNGKVLSQLKKLNPDSSHSRHLRKINFPNGKVTWQEWIDRGIFDDLGKVIEYQIVGRDVTIQKK